MSETIDRLPAPRLYLGLFPTLLVDAFHNVFLVGVVILAIGFVVGLVLPNLKLKEESGAEQRTPAADGSGAGDHSR